MPAQPLSRRRVLEMLVVLGFGAACQPAADLDDHSPPEPWGGGNSVDNHDSPARQNLEALMDVFIPSERDEQGNLLSAGALEAGAYEVVKLERMVGPARALGLIGALPDGFDQSIASFDTSFRATLSAALDALAADEVSATFFRKLSRERQIRAVARGLENETVAPLLRYVRTACFVAYFGAVENDLGLREIGFPAFEDFADRLAVSGYPRTVTDGRLIDPNTENLATLAAQGELDDYTQNKAPAPTPSDDLSSIVDEHGDLS
ncbi:MAG: hypothetical protein R3B13_17090 [Polyangiaceae bacterium]